MSRQEKKSAKKRSNIRLFMALLVISAIALPLLTPTGQKTLDAWQDDFRMLHQKIYYRLGKPLPGTPDLKKRDQRLAEAGLEEGDPVFIRIFKLEGVMELWMRGDEGFKRFASYPICRWSGGLGPKQKEGDRQSPEGIYTVAKSQLNPNSRWYKSFNLGYPNIYDKSYNRTGSFLMVHGGCSSIGCYAMTNPVMKEIWDLIRAAYRKGQQRIVVHAFPFHMTDRNLRVYGDNKWADFWQSLRPAYDIFNETRVPPLATVCRKNYSFSRSSKGSRSYQERLTRNCENITASLRDKQ